MDNSEYNIYRGLQKPFVLFGLKGINIAWGVGGGLGGMLVFAAVYAVTGIIPALVAVAAIAGVCVYKINYHNTHGLRNKSKMDGIWIPKNIIRPTGK